MNPDEKNSYIQYRLESSKKTFEAAKILAEKGYWNSAVNRLYYSLFYPVNEMLELIESTIKNEMEK